MIRRFGGDANTVDVTAGAVQLAAQEQKQEQYPAKPDSDDAAAVLGTNFSHLVVDETKSYYVNNVMWSTLANEVEELRDLLAEPDEADYESTPAADSPYGSIASPKSSPAASISQTGANAAIFGYRAAAHSLLSFHPTLPQAVGLFAAYTENVAPLVPMFHMPSLTRTYWDAVASLETLDKDNEALLFAIHYSAIISLEPKQCASILTCTRDAALEKYRFAVEQALARADLLNTQSLTLIQAAVLFLLALRNEDDSRTTWSLTALVYHISQTMGIHRDGTMFDLRPFETEMRRRLWAHICMLDQRSSEFHGYEPIINMASSDSKPPLHVNDVDLHPDMPSPPPERDGEVTSITLLLIRCEAMAAGHKLAMAAQLEDGSLAFERRAAVVEELKQRLEGRYLRHCNPSIPLHMICATVARLIMSRFWIMLHYPLTARRGPVDRPDRATRDKVFHAAVESLELSSQTLSDPSMFHWSWYARTQIHLGTLALVVAEIFNRPPSAECDRAWATVCAVYNEWETKGGHRGTLWQPVKRLMARAKFRRQKQQSSANLVQPAAPVPTEAVLPDPNGPFAMLEMDTSGGSLGGEDVFSQYFDLLPDMYWPDPNMAVDNGVDSNAANLFY